MRTLFAAGMGGMLPTLCKLGATYTAAPDVTPPPAIGWYIALAIFVVVGAIVAFFLDEKDMRKAFVLGIAAPGIVTNIVAGATQPKSPPEPTTETGADGGAVIDGSAWVISGVASALAEPALRLSQETTEAPRPAAATPKLVIDSTVTGKSAASYSQTLTVRFLSVNGTVVGQGFVAAKGKGIVEVPDGANTVVLSAGGKEHALKLPTQDFQEIKLQTSVTVTRSNDFLWALGAPRRPHVEAVSAKISEVNAPPEPAPEVQLQTGMTVYTESGSKVGVIQNVERTREGQPLEVTVKPAEIERTTLPDRSP